MARPKQDYPTPAELEILKVLWDQGPSSGRDVMEHLNSTGQDRAYTTVTSLLNIMVEKGLVKRIGKGRAFTYEARMKREKALYGLLSDLVSRAFEGSASALVAALLNDHKISPQELDRIRQAIDEHDVTH